MKRWATILSIPKSPEIRKALKLSNQTGFLTMDHSVKSGPKTGRSPMVDPQWSYSCISIVIIYNLYKLYLIYFICWLRSKSSSNSSSWSSSSIFCWISRCSSASRISTSCVKPYWFLHNMLVTKIKMVTFRVQLRSCNALGITKF